MTKQLDNDEVQILLKNQLSIFIEKVFLSLNPGTKFARNWHQRAIAHQLERCLKGECHRLLITMPPRCLKSISASVAFPAFIHGHNPSQACFRH